MPTIEISDEALAILNQRMLTYSLSDPSAAIKSMNREIDELNEIIS
jgi:hypothetical protein